MAAPPFRTILVLVDGTESAIKAAEHAIQISKATGARLTAVSVVDTETLRKLMTVHILVEQEMGEFEADLERSQRRHLDHVGALAKKAGVPIETVLRKGICHSAVLAEQKERNADLIVIGAFRATLTKSDLIARERQHVLEEAPCNVLVVK